MEKYKVNVVLHLSNENGFYEDLTYETIVEEDSELLAEATAVDKAIDYYKSYIDMLSEDSESDIDVDYSIESIEKKLN